MYDFLDLMLTSRANANQLKQVVWDDAVFPLLTANADEVILRERITGDIGEIIKGQRMLGASALFLDGTGVPIKLTEPWVIKLSGDERRLRLRFETEQGAEIVPPHEAFLKTLKTDMASYLKALQHEGSSSDIGYTQRFDYSRQYQHEYIAVEVYKEFKVGAVLPESEELAEVIRENCGSQFVSMSDWRKRFFCNNPYLPRAIFEFAQHAIAGYDQPFRAELQRRARYGGYDH